MALDFSKPALGDGYSAFAQYIRDHVTALAKGLDGETLTSTPTNAIRWNSTTKRWEKYNGTAWIELITKASDKYDINVDRVDGYDVSNATGNIPLSNGTVNTNLNADMIDGYHAGTAANQVLVLNSSGKIPSSVLGGASDVPFTPTGSIAATNVQAALAELDSEKLSLAGGTLSGGLSLSAGNVAVNGAGAAVTVGDNSTGRVTVDGGGSLEVFKSGGGYIDFKNASGDDYDVRLAQNGTGGLTTTGAGQFAVNGMDVYAASPPANTYAIYGKPTTSSYGGVIGVTQNGTISGVLGHSNQYSLYGNGRIYTGEYFMTAGGVVYLNAGGTRYVQYDSGNDRYVFGNTRAYFQSASLTTGGYGICTNVSGGDLYIEQMRWVSSPGYLEVSVYGTAVGIYADISDERLKDNIKPSKKEALPIIRALPFFEFDWKEGNAVFGEGHVALGPVAQAWEKVDPELVRQQVSHSVRNEEGEVTGEEKGLMQINPMYAAALALKGVQELERRIAALGY